MHDRSVSEVHHRIALLLEMGLVGVSILRGGVHRGVSAIGGQPNPDLLDTKKVDLSNTLDPRCGRRGSCSSR